MFANAFSQVFGDHYGAEMGKPKEHVLRGRSRAARGVVIALDRVERRAYRPQNKCEAKGKEKCLSIRNLLAIRMHDLASLGLA